MTAKKPDPTIEPEDTPDTETVQPPEKPKGYNQNTGEFVL
jgi:hypothetical protein